MAIITGPEIFDMVVMTLVAGYIFMDFFKRPQSDDPVEAFKESQNKLHNFWYACALVAPPIILHEFGHKFVAMSMGYTATFHAAYIWLAIGLVIKLLRIPFIVIVPAFVSITGVGITALQHSAIAFAGPAVNGLLWLVSLLIIKTQKLDRKWAVFWQYSLYINGLLFVFNMLPIPGFDGLKVYMGLYNHFF